MMFRNYEYFVAIAEAGSLTRAAEILYVSQPSLSQYLRRLESELGVELFNHRTSPLKLTYTGERYYESVKQMMRLEENIKRIPGYQEPGKRMSAAWRRFLARSLPASRYLS